jgi:c-di-GMP-binding flagellar brake protein YcgR
MPSPLTELDLERLRPCVFRLVIVGENDRRAAFRGSILTVSPRLILFGLSRVLPEREAPGGSAVEISYADDDGLHSFNSRAVALSPRGGLWVQRPDMVHSMQRRAHYRLRAQLGGHATVLRADGSVIDLDFHTRDLSAGGICFDAGPALSGEDDVGLALSLPGDPRVMVRAKVVRCLPHDGQHTIGVAFDRLPLGVESRIVKFINQEQIRRHSESTNPPPPAKARRSDAPVTR